MSQTDPTTGQPFAGDRLIQRVAQMHFGGTAIPIDSSATDANGMVVTAYGDAVWRNYNSRLSDS
jgi:hypothetical protein